MQVSDKDREAVESILTEVMTSLEYKLDAIQTHRYDHDHSHSRKRSHGSVADSHLSDKAGMIDLPLVLEEPDQFRASLEHFTTTAFDASLSTTSEASETVSDPIDDAVETKRFVKRSHALQELLATEESYINDLDILMHVHLRILESRSWFPQNIHTKMQRCVGGLLSLHRDFHARLLAACGSSDLVNDHQEPLRIHRDMTEAFMILDRDHHLYSSYCELRMRTINEINRSAGQTAMTLLQKESKELMAQQGRPSTRADVKDFLIKPIQRICRYPLLLNEVLRLSGEDDPEYEYVDEAYHLMKNKAQEMDETQTSVERMLLTEQFLKKLPETTPPRKTGPTPQKEQLTTVSENSAHVPGAHPGSSMTYGYQQGGNSSPGFPPEFFGLTSTQDGIVPVSLTKTFAGTLGSIVLAGALEYVNTNDMPLRLKYYGCFLFDSMLIIVKAKKANHYEPRQWLPLRLCELQETIQLDGYTRFGWRIVFDQFRIDFGANSAAEQQTWINTLQDRIQSAKNAHAKMSRDVAVLETMVSSLPWRMNKLQMLGPLSGRHLQMCQQTSSPLPSPWSVCSSAIPSPLMPPPPSATTSTMMMAMSSMVTAEPERWNARGSVSVLDAYVSGQDYQQSSHQNEGSQPHIRWQLPVHAPSTSGEHGETRIGGMASSGLQEKDDSDHPTAQPRTGIDRQTRPESSTHSLYSSTPVPWLMPDRQRIHSFDVTRMFGSINGSIKPNQRALVQSMFKDISTENVWTSTSALQPPPQQGSNPSRHSSSSPFSYFGLTGNPPSPRMTVSAPIHVPSLHLDGAAPAPDDDSTSGNLSLTSRLLRRRASGTAGQTLPSIANGLQDKGDCDRRRSTAPVVASTLSLNLRKNSDILQQSNLQRRPSIHDTAPEACEGDTKKTEKKMPFIREPFSLLSSKGTKLNRRSHAIDESEPRTEPPAPAQEGAIEDTFVALSNAGETARSRRGNGERIPRRGVTQPISQSLPSVLQSANASTHSLAPSQPTDVTMENIEKMWAASMGGASLQRTNSIGNNGGSSDMSGRSRSNSASSGHSSLSGHGGSIPVVYSSMHTEQGHELQSSNDYLDHNNLHHSHARSSNGGSNVISKVLLRRSSTNGSRFSTRTSCTSISSPLLAPHSLSPRISDHTRTDSVNSFVSMDSDLSLPGGAMAAAECSSPPYLRSTPAVSVTNCSSDSDEGNSSAGGVTMESEGHPHSLQHGASDRQGQRVHYGQEVTRDANLRGPQDQEGASGPQPAAYPPQRRKSISIIQNITNSATQKFRALVRTPSGLRRRRTVMSLSPITRERDSFADEAGDDGEAGVGTEDVREC
ncbi:hypothetical protein BGX31_010161 [Mortierella sp. GBA43]|nr:hypothetical protein BGX31_010161 [Mortierella sp. GBA43]